MPNFMTSYNYLKKVSTLIFMVIVSNLLIKITTTNKYKMFHKHQKRMILIKFAWLLRLQEGDNLFIFYHVIIFSQLKLTQRLLSMQLPASFDPMVLQDYLLQTLQRSPHTKQYATLRVQQIIRGVILDPLLNRLRKNIQDIHDILIRKQQLYTMSVAEIELLEQKLHQMDKIIRNFQYEKANQTKSTQKVRKASSQQLKKNNIGLVQIKKQNQNLKQQLQMLSSTKATLQQTFSSQIQRIEQNLEKKTTNLVKLEKDKIQLTKQNQILNQKIKTIENKYNLQSNQQLKKFEKNNEEYKRQLDKIKKQHHQLQQQCLKLKDNNSIKQKQIQQIGKKNQVIYNEYYKLKQKYKKQSLLQQKQKQAVTQKLTQLTKKYKLEQTIIHKLRQQLKYISTIKFEINQIKLAVKQQIKQIKGNVQKGYYKIMDEIGLNMVKQLESLMFKIGRMGGQLKIYKDDNKVKDQIIERLQRMLDSESSGTLQLRNQLRTKKKQQQRLRKQLAKHFQQTQIKLYSMQKKYKEILIDSSSYY